MALASGARVRYLSVKYGRVFLDTTSGWDWTNPYVNGINGGSSFSGSRRASSVAPIPIPAR